MIRPRYTFLRCPACDCLLRLEAEPYYGYEVRLRCRKCRHEWWFPVVEDEEFGPGVEDSKYEEARRLARLIIDEVKFYHSKRIAEAETIAEVLAAVEEDLELGRKHFFSKFDIADPEYERIFDILVKAILFAGKRDA